MNHNITDFYNNSGYYFNSGSGSFEEDKDESKVAKYIALSFLICFASIIVICILLLICNELCRKLPRINYNSNRYSIYSYNSNTSVESWEATNYTINNVRKLGKEKITDKVSQFFNEIINPIYDENLDNCAICLEKIDTFDKNNEPCTLNCNHTYHKRCITKYVIFNVVNGININCPLCRENIYIV